MPGTAKVHGARTLTKREQLLALFAVFVMGSTVTVSAINPVGAGSEPTTAIDVLTETTTDPVELAELTADVVGAAAGASDGTGVDVAIIDTGVASVDGLDADGKVLHGPDLSSEAGTADATVDTYGHGTHMAGIIAGERAGHEGVAPGARIVSVKASGDDGETSLPQLVAAIDWVIANKDVDGLNIRVLNLSFGHGQIDSHIGDPLSAAVERAWDAGIVVVVAAGNDGDEPGHLGSPAVDPYVLAVGATDSTDGAVAADQAVADFSTHGDGVRNPDLVAPGRSIASYRVPGSTIVDESPEGLHGDDLFRGSGSSQAAAVVAGVAARLIGEYPNLTADQVKATLIATATDLDAPAEAAGAGRVDLAAALASPAFDAEPQAHPVAITDGAPMHVWPAGEWQGAMWAGGVWGSATWYSATWQSGSWHSGSWHSGSWHSGSWHSGSWHSGSWHSGSWHSGSWHSGSWHSGSWHSGSWHSGSWHSGSWHSGSWHSGSWHSGSWHSGSWHSGSWHSGSWHSATWL